MIGRPFVEKLDDNIWEMRPLSNRIFFVAWHNGSYVLLHHFIKKSQKTPRKQLEQARREYEDLKAREDYE